MKRLMVLLTLALSCTASAGEVVDILDVAPVWGGHPVGFALLTAPPNQYLGFYDAERRMTIGHRKLDSTTFQFKRLDENIGWDSHNYIAMTLDDGGFLHVSGNMHVHPLKYWRSQLPYDAGGLKRVPAMVGGNETRCTYPVFFRGPEKSFLFTYRDGSSGSGNQIYNVYNQKTQQWKRLLDTPLVDGEGKRNAYLTGPHAGPDGYYHLAWVWRDTSDCATNHSVSYARSKDLVHWENSRGVPFSLPITYGTAEIVDPVPPGGGAINGNLRIGFDGEQRPILSYHKFDEDGKTQVYSARLESEAWRIRQSSDWDYRWEFGGGGTIHFEIRVNSVRSGKDGVLTQQWSHDKHGSQRWKLDPETLAPVEQIPIPKRWKPKAFSVVESDFPDMGVRLAHDKGGSGEAGKSYVLRWESLGKNRDRPREKPWPKPSMLQLYLVKN
jgi:hypothetical protein